MDLCCCCLHPGQWRRGPGWNWEARTAGTPQMCILGARELPSPLRWSDGWRSAAGHRGWWRPEGEHTVRYSLVVAWGIMTCCDLWYGPALWRRCWRWLGNAGTLDKTPSSASSASTCPPAESKRIVDIQQTTVNKREEWMHTNGSYLFRSALRDLG